MYCAPIIRLRISCALLGISMSSAFSTARTEAMPCTSVHTPQMRCASAHASRGSRPRRMISMPRTMVPADEARVMRPEASVSASMRKWPSMRVTGSTMMRFVVVISVSSTVQKFRQDAVLRRGLGIVGAAPGCDTLAGARHARVHRGLPRRTVTRLDRLEAGQRRPGNEMSGLAVPVAFGSALGEAVHAGLFCRGERGSQFVFGDVGAFGRTDRVLHSGIPAQRQHVLGEARCDPTLPRPWKTA